MRESKKLRGFVIVGLCGSFAVVPALSLFNSADSKVSPPRRLADPAPGPGDAGDASLSSGPVGLAALIASDAAWSATAAGTSSPAAASGTVAATLSPSAAGAPASAPPAPGAFRPPAAPAARAPTAPTPPAGRGAPAPPPAVPLVRPPTPPPVHATGGRGAQQGIASWLDIAAGTCANNAAPMGTVITVTSSTGVSIQCKVVSRGPFGPNRVVDLAATTFARLGSLSQGLVSVTVTW